MCMSFGNEADLFWGLSWIREDVLGELVRGSGQHGLGLGAEAGELLGMLLAEVVPISQPAPGAVVAVAGGPFASSRARWLQHGWEDNCAARRIVHGISRELW
jgi:hypothetical protein